MVGVVYDSFITPEEFKGKELKPMDELTKALMKEGFTEEQAEKALAVFHRSSFILTDPLTLRLYRGGWNDADAQWRAAWNRYQETGEFVRPSFMTYDEEGINR